MSATAERESVTEKTHRLVDAFEHARERVRRERAELNRSECDLANAKIALAKWLVPKDAKAGEQFNIWYGNRLICVTAGSEEVTIRTPPE